MTDETAKQHSFGRWLTIRATAHPDRIAIHFYPVAGPERRITYRELERQSNQVARLFEQHGLTRGSMLVVALPNCPEHYIASYAGWKVGATVVILRAALPNVERDQLLELANPSLVVCDGWSDTGYPTLQTGELVQAEVLDDAPLPDAFSEPSHAHASGGSTGRPKLIVAPGPGTMPDRFMSTVFAPLGIRSNQVQLVCGPLYHIMPWGCSYGGLTGDCHSLILLERFNPRLIPDLIEKHRVQFMYLAPIMMRRIVLEPDVAAHDFSSLDGVASTAAPVPPWLKQAWIDLIGPEKVTELYGSTEQIGFAMIDGVEWLKKPGSVGKPTVTKIRILDEAGQDLPPGEVGEIYMLNPNATGPSYEYIGAPPTKSTPDGYQTVGDLGWLDEDGYLYITDRRTDMIVTGGANVFAAEVEAAFADHSDITDITVIGVPDEEWGRRVHAIIQPVDPANPPRVANLNDHVRARLASYKAPKTYEFMAALPRNEAGKLRRTALAEERSAGWTDAMMRVPHDNSPRAVSGDASGVSTSFRRPS